MTVHPLHNSFSLFLNFAYFSIHFNRSLHYLSSDPCCGRQLVHGVHVPFLHLHAANDELLGLLLVHIVQVQGVDLSGEVAADLGKVPDVIH